MCINRPQYLLMGGIIMVYLIAFLAVFTFGYIIRGLVDSLGGKK